MVTLPVVKLERIALPSNKVSKKLLKTFTGGDEHRWLCGRAATWIEQQGWTWSNRGCRYGEGLVADLRAVEVVLYVECGTTRAEKVLKGVPGGKLLVCPYGENYGYLVYGEGVTTEEKFYTLAEIKAGLKR